MKVRFVSHFVGFFLDRALSFGRRPLVAATGDPSGGHWLLFGRHLTAAGPHYGPGVSWSQPQRRPSLSLNSRRLDRVGPSSSFRFVGCQWIERSVRCDERSTCGRRADARRRSRASRRLVGFFFSTIPAFAEFRRGW